MKKYIVLLGILLSISCFSMKKVQAEENIIGLDNIRTEYEAGTDPNSIDFTKGLKLYNIDEALTDDKLLVDYTQVNFDKVGVYPLTYYVLYLESVDQVKELATIYLNIVDTISPTLHGVKPIVVNINTDLDKVDLLSGVYARDNDLGSELNINVLNRQKINTSKVGTYPIVYVVNDDSLNSTKQNSYVLVTDIDSSDKVAPTITFKQEKISVGLNSHVHDYSIYAEALDNDGTNLTNFIEFNDSNVDYTTIGTYKLLYMVSDFSGNVTIDTIDVDVAEDTVGPYFVNFPEEIRLNINEGYVLGDGIVAYDDICGDVSDRIEYIANKIDITTFGEYKVIFKVSDLNNNETIKSVKVSVGDYLAPTIEGPSSIKIEKGDDFDIFTVLEIEDNFDTNVLTEADFNGLNTNKVGSYMVRVLASDHYGNEKTKDIMVTVYEINSDKFYEQPVVVGSIVGVVVSGIVTYIGLKNHRKKRKS